MKWYRESSIAFAQRNGLIELGSETGQFRISDKGLEIYESYLVDPEHGQSVQKAQKELLDAGMSRREFAFFMLMEVCENGLELDSL